MGSGARLADAVAYNVDREDGASAFPSFATRLSAVMPSNLANQSEA